jgi:hypothetical protein
MGTRLPTGEVTVIYLFNVFKSVVTRTALVLIGGHSVVSYTYVSALPCEFPHVLAVFFQQYTAWNRQFKLSAQF